jgi:hypothetical protein
VLCRLLVAGGDEIQLIYQGKVLLEGNTLEEVDLQPNDTVIAVIPALAGEEKEERAPPPAEGLDGM